MNQSGDQEQLPLEKSEAKSAAQAKSRLYAQLNTSARPLDRLRRPIRNDDTDFSELVDDLNFSFNDQTPATPNQPLTTNIAVEHQAENEAAIAVSTTKQSQAFAPVKPKQSSLPKLLKSLAVLILIALSTAFGYAAASLFIKPAEPTANNQVSSQSDAEWKKAQAQWECTLKQYQANQAAQTNNQPVKEVSCAN